MVTVNSLRAAVLGANDGIISNAALLLGVIGSGASDAAILTAGIASTVAGAVSMALGEYVSVSAQRDTERAAVEREIEELEQTPDEEAKELAGILSGYGISDKTAHKAAQEIGEGDPLTAHLQIEYGLDGEKLTNPWEAAAASGASFLAGAALPLASVFFSSNSALVVFATTLLALVITCFTSAKLSDTGPVRAVLRLVLGGALGLAVTYGIGAAFGGVVG